MNDGTGVTSGVEVTIWNREPIETFRIRGIRGVMSLSDTLAADDSSF
ncbi:hypothetical protein ABGB19_16790 [Mycobacterium sp. B14F4]